MARHLLNSYDDRREVFDMTENKRHLQHWNAGLREVVSLSFFASNPNAHKSGFNSWRQKMQLQIRVILSCFCGLEIKPPWSRPERPKSSQRQKNNGMKSFLKEQFLFLCKMQELILQYSCFMINNKSSEKLIIITITFQRE